MSDHRSTPRALAVPGTRIARLARFGSMASGMAGSMALNGARQWAGGDRPRWRDLLLTPANAARMADELARMRGAAMKVGQLISMDAGEVLPPELADVFARLRAEAHFMPPKQLKPLLIREWGADWQKQFRKFDVRPIAAASIGQVHRAETRDGRSLAVKIQYPGVRRSIDSDVANVASIIKLSGLIPKGLDMTPLLDEARAQLHEEADYAREGRYLSRFATLLADSPEFHVPDRHTDLTTENILAMTYAPGDPLESLANSPQDLRDRVATQLFKLFLRELFEFHLMQTDPNFANYRYDPATARVVLLDFGATREFGPASIQMFRAMLEAGSKGDRLALYQAACDLGYLDTAMPAARLETLLDMLMLATSPMRQSGPFDFALSDLAGQLHQAGLELGMDNTHWTLPEIDALFVQRKVAGLYLLARRIGARVPLADLIAPYLSD